MLPRHGCKIAPSTYYACRKRREAPSPRAMRDGELKELLLGGIPGQPPRLRGERDLAAPQPPGPRGGPPHCRAPDARDRHRRRRAWREVITTLPDRPPPGPRTASTVTSSPRPPNRTWVGVVHVAFVVDTFPGRIVGWSASMPKETQLVLDALDTGPWQRDRDGRPPLPGELVHHFDAGVAIHVIPPGRTPRRGPHRGLDRLGRRHVRQRAHGVDDRPVQDRGHQAAAAVEDALARRARHRRVGRPVRPPPTLL
uniref:Transposase n=1 Tax=Streptomyces ipomoeae 91-03 TaxID=698759 RepID=I3P631_9ACTN|nr:transposase [Streptomyces ipomoeae 91-03]